MATDVDFRADPDNGALFAELVRLELAVLDPAVRTDAASLDALLADDFVEFGRSGVVASRAATIAALVGAPAPHVVAEDFAARRLGDGVVLLTCRTHRAEGEARKTLRSSVWVRERGRWRMAFHQGTPAA